MRKISVIIPVYNALEHTKVCIENVEVCLAHRPYEIIVVDNASTDGTAEYLAGKDNVRVIANREPESVAAAFNKGYRMAAGELILFMHNDTVLPPYSIDLLENALYSDDKLGAVGPTAQGHRFWPHELLEQIEEYDDIAGMGRSFEKARRLQCNLRPAFVLEDFCSLFKREAIDDVGEWDESFLLRYFEDVDYSCRMQLKGWKLAIVPNVFVHHFQAATFKANQIDHEKAWKIFSNYFKKKWNFSFEYSIGVRDDLLKYIDVKRENVAVLDSGRISWTAGISMMYPSALSIQGLGTILWCPGSSPFGPSITGRWPCARGGWSCGINTGAGSCWSIRRKYCLRPD